MSNPDQRCDVSTSPKTAVEVADDRTPPKSPPPPPVPSSDPRLAAQAVDNIPSSSTGAPASQVDDGDDDIFAVPPLAALKLLSSGIEALVSITGDIPPTPPPAIPHIPSWRGMRAEKESIVRSHSERSLARMRELAEQAERAEKQGQQAGSFPWTAAPAEPSPSTAAPAMAPASAPTTTAEATNTTPSLLQQVLQPPLPSIDGVQLRAAPTSPPAAPRSAPEPYLVIGADSQPLNLQHSAITRKFYSKKPPPIGVTDYLGRMHRFCPMSTAVYLATSLYIHRLAVDERAIAVTRRNAHRLLLAGLRVAMKALEDLSYPHAKMAKVGGVSELELARLEISFCFLAGFELVVDEETLRRHWCTLKAGKALGMLGSMQGNDGEGPVLRLERRPKSRDGEGDEG